MNSPTPSLGETVSRVQGQDARRDGILRDGIRERRA
jgi:hypothetical protein